MAHKKIVDYIIVDGSNIEGHTYARYDKSSNIKSRIEYHKKRILELSTEDADFSEKRMELENQLEDLKAQLKSNEENRLEFEEEVMSYLERGFVPLGGVSVSRDKAYQALIRYDD